MRSIVDCGLLMLSAASAWAGDDTKIEVNDLVAPISPDVLVVREDGQRPSVSTLDWPLQVTRTNLVHLKLDTDPPVYLARDEALTVDDAIEHYNEKIVELTEDDALADWLVLRGDCHMHNENSLKGTSDYLSAYKLKSDSERYALKAIEGCQDTQQYAETLRICDELLQKKPDLAVGHSWRGRALSGLNDFRGAIAAFDHAILLDPKDADTYSRRSFMHLVTRDYELAIRDARKAIELDPSEEHYVFGTVAYALAGKPQAAIDCAREGIAVHASNELLIATYVCLLYESRQEDLLEDKFRQIKSIADMINVLETIRAKQEDRTDDALKQLTRGIENQSRFLPFLLTMRGDLLWERGEQDAAMKDWDTAIELDPSQADALVARGSRRLTAGDVRGARADFTTAIDVAPDCEGAYLGLAQLLRSQGELTAARGALEAARKVVPTNQRIELAEARIDLASGAFAATADRCTQVLDSFGSSAPMASGVLRLSPGKITISIIGVSTLTPVQRRYQDCVSALALRSYAQAQRGSYAAALADAWQICTLPVVSK